MYGLLLKSCLLNVVLPLCLGPCDAQSPELAKGLFCVGQYHAWYHGDSISVKIGKLWSWSPFM